MKNKHGFTLIEVLIALAIVSIAFTAIIVATSENIRNTRYLENKMVATWVGMDIINKIRAGIIQLPEGEPLEENTHALGQPWYWKASMQAGNNLKIFTVTVDVSPAEKSKAIIHLVSYVYK